MTNFFEHQAAARRKTIWLIAYFIAAIVGLIACTYLLVSVVFVFPDVKAGEAPDLLDPTRLVGVTGCVLLLVSGFTGYKIVSLSAGGSAVALQLGGRELSGPTRDARERRLLNVVEEMSIASGVPMPQVYVLDDEVGINAFAAGYAPGDAVVAVSRGCLENLTRDELQGVIAHEFSHILNGDMRLNIRLMGFVFGILGLALIGQFLMRSASQSSSRRSSKGRGQIVMFGIGLYLLGMIGAFFGNLIKAAVSRQREYLADASAVQFTRNPDGIGGALMKIGGLDKGPNLDHPSANEVSHMFFADALLAKRLSNLLATHPPLNDRIKRVLPHWDGNYSDVSRLGDKAAEEQVRKKRSTPLSAGMPALPGLPYVPFPILAEDALDRAGTITPGQTGTAVDILGSIPQALREAAEEPFGARVLVYGLLLDSRESVREAQLARLQSEAEQADYKETLRLSRLLADLPDDARLPLIDVAIPALRRMSPAQYEVFRTQVDHLTHMDQCVSIFEFVLRCVLDSHLDASFGRKKRPHQVMKGVRAHHVATVLSLLAWEGHENAKASSEAYDAGMRSYLRGANTEPMLERMACGLEQLEEALQVLSGMRIEAKRRLLVACAACIAADRETTVREAELFRAIGDLLGCPIPPLSAPSSGQR